MPDNSFERQLEIFFSKSSKADWKKIAMRETHGNDPFEFLSWRGKDEILFLPYYDAESVAKLDFLKTFQLPASQQTPYEIRTWANLPEVSVIDERTANTLALENLSLGADGVMFDLRKTNTPDFDQLMNEIKWPYCSVSIRANSNDFFLNPLSTYIKKNYDPTFVKGALFWDSSPKNSNLEFYIRHCINFRSLGLIIPTDTPTMEVAEALLAGVKTFDAIRSRSDSEQIFKHISFSLSTDAFLMESIAKLKALRMLWFQVAQAYGQKHYKPDDLHIHTRSMAVADHRYTPRENMLKGTFSAIAAIVGGCDSLTIESEQQPQFVQRWARNVSSILREESFFNQAADPLAGSYALDAMVDAISIAAWEKFQAKCKDL